MNHLLKELEKSVHICRKHMVSQNVWLVFIGPPCIELSSDAVVTVQRQFSTDYRLQDLLTYLLTYC